MRPGFLSLMGFFLIAPVSGLADVPEPDTYRSAPYAAEVPQTLAGAQVIDGAGALALHAQGVPFIDVYPQTRRPDGLPADTLWREPIHETIPGAIWAADTGYERLSEDEQARLEAALQDATGGDPAQPVVLFCRRDCWLSWNAARRVLAMGYSAVIWFPDGVEGWLEAGGKLEPANPAGP